MRKFWTLPLELKPAGGAFDDPALLVAPANRDLWLLFDCGTLHGLKTRDLQKVRWLFLTHLHIDHLIGFDHLLRIRLFSELPLTIYGPSGTLSAISHRLKGYAWNLTSGSPFRVRVFEYPKGNREGLEFPCHHSFDPRPVDSADLTERPSEDGVVCLPGGIAVSAHPVQHGVPCLAYRLDRITPPKFSVEAAAALGLRPGPWVSALVEGQDVSQTVEGQLRGRDWLAERLLAPPVRHGLGFLTDTRLDDELVEALEKFFAEVDVLCCETAYLSGEAALARQNLHMTTEQAARLALRSKVGALLIFHLSRRHCEAGNAQHLAEVRQVFANSELLESVSRAASESPS